ncbi:hypothetical protein L0152_06770 [bacterium]|nr:hypothetical protein [bacterium]
MSTFVIDVNVLIVANYQTPQANLDCIAACVNALTEIAEKGIIVLDDGLRILSEYKNYTSFAGQPGVGDAFFKLVFDNQAVDSKCHIVHLTPKETNPEDFDEFPADPRLSGFDYSDRKYAAAALCCPGSEVLNASDTDWWHYRVALIENGIQLRFLCPQLMSDRNG